MTVEIIAHRGASLDAPENTLEAFELALRQGADRIELDVQLDGDGTPIVHHDATLERVTDAPTRHPHRAPWDVRSYGTAELEELAVPWPDDGNRDVTCRVATLASVLTALGGRTRLLLELKDPARHPGLVEATVATLRSAPVWLDPAEPDQLTVQSFDHEAVVAVRHLLPSHVSYGWVFAEGVSPEPAAVPRWVRDLVVDHRVAGEATLATAHAAERRVLTWTVNDPGRMAELIHLGVDGIITDAPGVLRGVSAEVAAASRVGGGW